jgi:hypothetical protein
MFREETYWFSFPILNLFTSEQIREVIFEKRRNNELERASCLSKHYLPERYFRHNFGEVLIVEHSVIFDSLYNIVYRWFLPLRNLACAEN